MMSVLDWINLDDLLPLVVLIGLLIFIGGQMTRPTPETNRITRRVGYITWVLYAGTALYSWDVSGPMDFVGVALRASLATGLVYGLTLIVIPAIDAASVLMKVKTMPKSEPWTPPPSSTVEQKVAPKPDTSDRERKAQVDDARNEVSAFYDKHEEIHEAYPPELLRSQVAGRFTDGLKPDQAWTVAQEMIASMLPRIAEVREKKRAADEEERKRTEQIAEEERKRTEAEERRCSFQKLADWYLKEQKAIRDSLPEGQDRDDALLELFQRYDRLMKDMYAEMQP